MIIIDTGPIVALFDKDDQYHQHCIEILKGIKEPLVTTWPVITEAFYLLNFSDRVQDALWQFIQRGGIRIEQSEETIYIRIRELMKKYHDLPMDLADATLVVLGEEMKLSTIFTLDHKDFSIYRLKHKRRFILIPAKL
ncbi:MAG TPA: PIN domain-containing protein [Thermodesulfovibrionales bacterium]|nr:PIN domain-containing protein [Thermodesulfovibrionales bacterium]